MFCPSCGLDERNPNQFCRACGTDLRPVRNVLQKPDSITASAEIARQEIGRAFAIKIQQMDSASELNKIAEEGLPYIEKFLESPAERRLRRIRSGSLVSFIGLGATITFTIASIVGKDDFLFFAAGSMVCLFIGLGLVVNGLFFSLPKNSIEDKSFESENQRELDDFKETFGELPAGSPLFSSVTERTTKNLKVKQPVPRN